jgi:hypothetical protein
MYRPSTPVPNSLSAKEQQKITESETPYKSGTRASFYLVTKE